MKSSSFITVAKVTSLTLVLLGIASLGILSFGAKQEDGAKQEEPNYTASDGVYFLNNTGTPDRPFLKFASKEDEKKAEQVYEKGGSDLKRCSRVRKYVSVSGFDRFVPEKEVFAGKDKQRFMCYRKY